MMPMANSFKFVELGDPTEMRKTTAAKKPSKKNSRARTRIPKTRALEDAQTLLNDRMMVLGQVLGFKQFLGSSFEPVISDSEIVVCFADIRGFTNYCRTLQKEMQDRKIQNFLRTYVKIFNEGLMRWLVENIDIEDDEDAKDMARYVIPSMYKNLGDGMMIVWEVPPTLDLHTQGLLAQSIVEIISKYRGQLLSLFSQPHRR
jgi:hypothetical protein